MEKLENSQIDPPTDLPLDTTAETRDKLIILCKRDLRQTVRQIVALAESGEVNILNTEQLEKLILREVQIRMYGRMLEKGLFRLPYNYIKCLVC